MLGQVVWSCFLIRKNLYNVFFYLYYKFSKLKDLLWQKMKKIYLIHTEHWDLKFNKSWSSNFHFMRLNTRSDILYNFHFDIWHQYHKIGIISIDIFHEIYTRSDILNSFHFDIWHQYYKIGIILIDIFHEIYTRSEVYTGWARFSVTIRKLPVSTPVMVVPELARYH